MIFSFVLKEIFANVVSRFKVRYKENGGRVNVQAKGEGGGISCSRVTRHIQLAARRPDYRIDQTARGTYYVGFLKLFPQHSTFIRNE